ncbi:MAG: guanylate kinase [Opitutales bacterium]
MSAAGLILVISGPAGAGKTTLCDRLLAEFEDLERVVTTTSRAPRAGERDGVDYHFLSVPEFKAKIAADEFYEWAQVHGRYYGSERRAVRGPLQAGRDLLLNIDVQGAANYRRAAARDPFLAECLHTVFIRVRDLAQMRERLEARGTESPEEIARRIRTAEEELREAPNFDDVIITGEREADYAAMRAIFLRERAARGGSGTAS